MYETEGFNTKYRSEQEGFVQNPQDTGLNKKVSIQNPQGLIYIQHPLLFPTVIQCTVL